MANPIHGGDWTKRVFRGRLWSKSFAHVLRTISSTGGIARVAVGSDMNVTTRAEGIRAKVHQYALNEAWSVVPLDELLQALDDNFYISWISCHLFGPGEMRLTEVLPEDAELFTDRSYRQNPSAIAEIYGWDDSEMVVVGPLDLVGALSMEDMAEVTEEFRA